MSTNSNELVRTVPDTVTALQCPTFTQQPLLLKVCDVAHLLQISRTAVYTLMERGELSYVKIGATRRIEFAAVQRLIDGSRVGQGPMR